MSLPHFGIIKKDPDWMSSDNRFMYKQIMCVNKFCFEKKTPGLRPCVYSHSQDEFNMAWQLYHMNAGNLSVALQYKQKEPPIDKSHPLWKKKILCQKCLADKPEPSCAYAHSNVEAAAATATAEAPTAPTEAATAPIDKSNSSWRKQIICQKCPPNQPPKASCGYSHSCTEFEAAWSLVKQKQADEEKAQKEKEEKAQEEKAQKEKEEKAQEEKAQKEKEEKAQKVKEAKAQKAKEAKEKKEQEEKEAKEKKEQEEKAQKEKEQEEKAQKEKEEKAQKAKEARAQKAKEAKEAKEQEEKAAAATWAALQEQKEKEEKEEKAQKAKEARAQKVKAQKEAPPPPYEPQPPSPPPPPPPPPIVEDDNVSTTSTSSKKKPAKEKIPSAVKRIVWNTYIGKDNLKGTCLCCNSEEVTVTNFECGHVKSEKNGGEVTVYNLRPICSNCNKSVGANDMDDFMKRYGISTPKNWNGLGSAAAATAAPKSKKDK